MDQQHIQQNPTPVVPMSETLKPAEHHKRPGLSVVLRWALILAMIVVVNVFFASVIQLAYPSPEYKDFCPDRQVYVSPDTQEECVAQGGQWTENPSYKPDMSGISRVDIVEQVGYCNPDYTCSKEYDDVRKGYERNIFMLWVAFGIMLILLSVFIANMGAISLGFSLGGVIALVVGTMIYWSDMDAWVKVVVLGIALVVLITLWIRKFRD